MCPVSKLIGRPRDLDREKAIHCAAISLIKEVGYDRTTIEEIATRAKVSKATVYRRWKNKQELVTEVVKNHVKHNISNIDTGSLREDLIELINSHVTSLKGEDGSLLIGLLTSSQSDPRLSQLLNECKPNEVQSVALEILNRAKKRKEINGDFNLDLLGEAVGAILINRIAITRQPVDRNFIESIVDGILMPTLTNEKQKRKK